MEWFPYGIPLKTIKRGPKGPPGNGFKLTEDGHYDMENKILKNCHDPIDNQDVNTKKYVLEELTVFYDNLEKKIDFIKKESDDSFNTLMRITSENMQKLQVNTIEEMKEYYLYSKDKKVFDAKNRRIVNVENPIDDEDVVNKKYIDNRVFIVSSFTYDNTHNYLFFNISNNYYFKDDLTLKFDMTMVLTLYFEAIENFLDRISFHTDKDSKMFDVNVDKMFTYNYSAVLKGEKGDKIFLQLVTLQFMKNLYLKIEIIK